MATFRAVVTGASSGIGRATALLLAKDGHALVLSARREDELNRLAQACLAGGAAAVSVVAGDLREPSLAPRLADAVEQCEEGEIALVNCAGVAGFGPFHELEAETSATVIEVGLVGAVRAVRALLPLMLVQERGTVVNVLSVAATQAFGGAEAYCAAKAGLLAFSRSLALDYRARGVRVTALMPGATDTPLWDAVAGAPDRSQMLSPQAVAETVKMVLDSPRDRAFDEIALMPPKGVL